MAEPSLSFLSNLLFCENKDDLLDILMRPEQWHVTWVNSVLHYDKQLKKLIFEPDSKTLSAMKKVAVRNQDLWKVMPRTPGS